MPIVRFNNSYFSPIFLMVSLFFFQGPAAQELKVVNEYKMYQQTAAKDSLLQMVELNARTPGVIIDLRYATKDNFTGKKFYPKGGRTFVRLAVAKALEKVQAELAASGYRIKVWDAYRPYAVTQKMWELVGDERYVANPAKGSGHNRGLAIDLTLMKDGKEVNMGTGFDNFTDTAHHAFQDLPEEVLKNRLILKTTMEKHGFRALQTEWWHYSFPNDRNYDVLNLSFKELGKQR